MTEKSHLNGHTYDGFDRLSQITYPIGSTGTHTSESLTYDADDNVVTRTTRAGDTISFGYDTLNRLCTKTIATSATACTATSAPSPTVWFGHDLAGRVTSTSDNSAAIAAAAPGAPVSYAVNYSYDPLNRPVNVKAAGSPVVEPAPLGAPLCAYANEPASASAAASAMVVSFMAVPFG